MANLFLSNTNGKELADTVREAFPRNPQVLVKTITYPGKGNKIVEERRLKFKGVSLGNAGLIFTFEDGTRHILEPLNEANGDDGKINLVIKPEPRHSWQTLPYHAQVKFINHEGASVTLTLK